MNVNFQILLLILLVIFSSFTCNSKSETSISKEVEVIKNDTVQISTNNVRDIDTNKPKKKQKLNKPSYIPPGDGEYNEKWNCYRLREMDTKREGYFGRGLQKRHRYRGGWQESE